MTLLRALPLLAAVLLAACDLSDPPVATSLEASTARTITASAGAEVPVAPAVALTDQRGRGLANVLVTWQTGANSGSVGVDTVRTDSRGVAESTRWTLGTGVGQQTLVASVSGLAPVVFTATVAAGPPASIVRRVSELQSARVASLAPEVPRVQVFDAFGNPVAGASVTFAVQQGGGVALGNVQPVTDAAGEAAIDGWQLGTTTAVEHRLTATVPSLPVGVTFRASARADVPVRIEPAAPLQQEGVPALAVATRPAVRALDQYGNPASGATIVFTPATGSGTVSGSVRTTSEIDGIARVGNWVLSADSVQTLRATSTQFPADTLVFRVSAVSTLFFVETEFLNGEPSARNLQAVERAVQRWRNVIAGQLDPALVIANAEACGPGVPAINETIVNLRIYINFDSIDGPGSVLGRAGPCIIRVVSGLPVVGYVELDTADLANLDKNGTLDDVMAHEFGHVLGLQAFSWSRRGLLANPGGSDPFFQGAVGRDGFNAIGGISYPGVPVPLENTGGAGTRDSHWRLSVLRRELMVGFAQEGGMPLSRLSIGALADLGYQVRLENAEDFVVPPFGSEAYGALLVPGGATAAAYGNDHWPSPVWAVDAAGRQRLVRASDWRSTRRR